MEMPALIRVGGDHAGFSMKEMVIAHLNEKGYAVKDFGPFDDQSVDYPDYVHPLADELENESEALAIVICGSGNGVAITANKHKHIRAALAWKPKLAALARQHNNANVLALPARFIDETLAKEIIDQFLGSTFEGGRHARRVSKIPICE